MEQKAIPAAQKKMRVNSCPLYKKCGGCQLQNMTYQQQLQWKQRKVEQLLAKFSPVFPILPMEHPFHYRNKVQAAFGVNRNNQIISGVYQSSTHRIVPVEHCLIEDEKADEIIVTVRNMLKSFKLSAYNEYSEKGFLRHVLVKRGFTTGEIMVVLVTSTPVFPSKKNFVAALLKKHPDITTILLNVNPYRTSLVLGEKEMVLYGKGYIEDVLCGCRFRISARSFYQVNPIQTEHLYGAAVQFAGLTGKETVIDAYCGIGTIGLIVSRQAARVIGVESNAEAVRDAICNAKLNRIENVHFYCADAGDYMVSLAESREKVDVVFMDPPRSGSDERFLVSVARLSPKKLVYISCNPETQERDIRFLLKFGYRVKKIQPVDMFPHTNHVETVVLLQRESL